MTAQMGAQYLIGHRLLDRDGNSVGKIGQVFFDDQTDQPKWVTVRTGLLGTNENFVPLRGANMIDDALQAAYTTEEIKAAPSFAIDEHLSVYQEDMIYGHYGLSPEVPAPRSAEGQSPQQRGRHARSRWSVADAPDTGDTTPADTEEQVPEPTERVSVTNIDEHRFRDAGDGIEREGVRVLRPGDDDPSAAS